MEFVTYRILGNWLKTLRDKLDESGELMVTSNGRPFAILVGVTPDEVEEALYLITQLRAKRAVSEMRATAREKGLDNLSLEEIEAKIQAVRAVRS